jgi:hypothetical protein
MGNPAKIGKTDTIGPNQQTGWKYPYQPPQSKRSNMIIKSIKWISKSAEEAEVEISDGNFTCIAFSQPCNVIVGEHLIQPLHVFSVKNAMISDQSAVGIWNLSDTKLERKVISEVIDITNLVVAVGDIHMVIDDFLTR